MSAKQIHVLFREDLLKLNTISKETKLLCHYHIDTAEQLFSLKDRLQKQMEQCVEERKHLRYKIRANRPEEEIQELKETDQRSDRRNWNAQKGGGGLRWDCRTFQGD